MHEQSIAIGVVINEMGKVLVSRREKDVHMPEVWEFPGGKLETGESFKQALRREIQEETGVEVKRCNKIVDFNFSYDDRHLHFQVFTVYARSEQVSVNEKQKIMWLDQHDLSSMEFPPANKIIINAICMPQAYMIADHSVIGDSLAEKVHANLEQGIKQIQFRAPSMNKQRYLSMAAELYDSCHKHGARLILNCDIDWYLDSLADGLHLTSQRLEYMYKTGADHADIEIYSASCHSSEELDYANAINVSSVLIGPVLHTHSHPHARPLGWARFSSLCTQANMPAYAVGGLGKKDIPTARVNGAQGIAGIRDFVSI